MVVNSFSVGVAFFIAILFQNYSFGDEQDNDENLAELFSLQAPVVFTASKQQQSLENAPSVMTVIDDKEIKIKGYRSVEDALFRTVGFWPTRQFTWNGILGSRGLVQDKNSHYLFLTDGHSLNNIDDSHSQTYQFPTIDKVKAIEIVRGPGSTMWGSDAALGIINIITKNGADINGFNISTELDVFAKDSVKNHPFNWQTNVLYGKKFSDSVDAMFSFTFWNGDGWESKNRFPFDSAYHSSIPVQAYDQSWEMYTKVKAKEFTFKGGFSRGIDAMGWSSSPDLSNRTSNTWLNFWLESQWNHQLAQSIGIEVKAFTDWMDNNYFLSKVTTPVSMPVDSSTGEYSNLPANDFGTEAMVSGTNFKNHQWKIGLRYVRTYTGPSVGARVWDTGGVYYAGDGKSNLLLYNKDGIDNILGLYAEDQWQFLDNWIAIVGGRVDHNDLRENGSQFMPRAGLIYKPLDKLTLKYLFNSGYLRPSQFQAANYRYHDVTNSEKIYSNDLQALWQSKNTQITATVFLMFVNDYITWVDAADTTVMFNIGGNASGNYNVGNFQSKGVELEAKQNIGQKLSLYSNCSYAVAKLGTDLKSLGIVNDKLAWHGIPTIIGNIGFDLTPINNVTLNANFRGWNHMTAKRSTKDYSTFWWLEGRGNLDLTLAYNKIAGIPLSASLYGFNVLNNDKPIADANVGGPMLPKPRTISGKIGYQF